MNIGGQEISMSQFVDFGFPKIAAYGKYLLWMILIFAGYYILYLVTTYKYKITVFEVGGGGGDRYSIIKIKTNRAKLSKTKNYWQTLFPFNNKKKHPIPTPELIYPGKRLFAYEYDGYLVPMRIEQINSNTINDIRPIPKEVSEFEALELQNNEQEFRKMDKWTENKGTIMVLVIGIICAAMLLGTVYFTYQFVTGGMAQHTNALNAIGEAVKNQNVIPGK